MNIIEALNRIVYEKILYEKITTKDPRRKLKIDKELNERFGIFYVKIVPKGGSKYSLMMKKENFTYFYEVDNGKFTLKGVRKNARVKTT